MFVRKKIALTIFLIFAAVLGGAAAVAAFTAPLEFAPRKAVLTAERGIVEIRRAGSDVWTNVSWTSVGSTVEVREGDSVRTGADGAATIDYFDQGQARLDADTAITLEKLRWDPQRPTAFVGEVLLESGRLWSRLMDFLTPESAYVAKTANTVATIRGTAFALSSIPKGYEGVFVAEHAVQVEVRQGGTFKGGMEIGQGMTARIDRNVKSTKPITTKAAAWDEKEGAWIGINIPKDRAFDDGLAERRLAEAKSLLVAEPGSSLARLADAAEKIRLAVTFDKATEAELRQRFLARHMLAVFVSTEEGRTEEAKAMMAATTRTNDGKTAAPDDGTLELNADVGMAASFLAQRRAVLRDDMIEAINAAAPKAARMIERVKERRLKFELLEPVNLKPTSPIEKDAAPLPTAGDPVKTDILAPTNINTAIIVNPGLTDPAKIDPAPAPVAAKPVSLKVSADSQNMTPGGKTSLHAWLVMSDGSSQDVTSKVRWSAPLDIDTQSVVGTIDGNMFIAGAEGGKTFVSAVVATDGGTLNGSVEITVLVLEL
ncbi:hypothetical protein HY633_03420 [Candidatus Uhrbacteria bacterium]|nr:hypothetical protein [Candidatus Uhrbacteria bacterium]